jgi:uncharacterized SAM-binding protein YcdF (DUF218 family)
MNILYLILSLVGLGIMTAVVLIIWVFISLIAALSWARHRLSRNTPRCFCCGARIINGCKCAPIPVSEL